MVRRAWNGSATASSSLMPSGLSTTHCRRRNRPSATCWQWPHGHGFECHNAPTRPAAGSRAGVPNVEHFCLALAPFDEPELASWFASRGVGVIDPAARYGAEGQGRSFYIEDPDGNRIEVKGARER